MRGANAYSIRSLVHAYDGTTAIEIPRLDIQRGRIYGLAGPNGSGKTTLLSILALLKNQSSGILHINGVRVTPSLKRQLRRKVTLIHQKPILFSRSVRSNISYGLRASGFSSKDVAARAQAIIEEAGLTSIADRPARTLSGGEAQRVVLARGLVLETPILLLDEPTNSLDDDFRPILLELLRKANRDRGATIVLATHDVSFISAIADVIIQMKEGRLLL
jgi:tungstate transport system ATP-binding protein